MTNFSELKFSLASAEPEGRPDAPLVLCLHGFPDDFRTFDALLPRLAAAGFRAAAPMLRGYEPGTQVADYDYRLENLALDVVDWLDHFQVEQAHLIGHDWGAAIAYTVAGLRPERFLSVTTAAVPQMKYFVRAIWARPVQVLNSWYMGFFQLPGLPESRIQKNDFAFLDKLWRDWSPGWNHAPSEIASVKETFRAPGVVEAALAYYRALPAYLLRDDRAGWRTSVPVMAVTGERDGCIDTRLFDDMKKSTAFTGGLRVERMADAGHFMHREKPDEFGDLIVQWLRDNN